MNGDGRIELLAAFLGKVLGIQDVLDFFVI
jgi:hypothetical protein